MKAGRIVQLSPVYKMRVEIAMPDDVAFDDPLAPLKRIARKHAPVSHHVRVIPSSMPFTDEQLPT